MPALIITLDIDDPSDVDWLRNKVVPAVENVVEENESEGRLDGEVQVSWEEK